MWHGKKSPFLKITSDNGQKEGGVWGCLSLIISFRKFSLKTMSMNDIGEKEKEGNTTQQDALTSHSLSSTLIDNY